MSQPQPLSRRTGVSITAKRASATVLALSALVIGGWASIAPHSFYTTFPLPGRRWVSMAGAYDEHLVRDVGGLYLALLVITCWAIVRATREAFAVTGGAWSVFSLPHLLFHATHLDGMGGLDSVAEVASLALSLLLALALLLPQPRGGESP
jgi:hypothetical protein